jgi:hypothetical protein
VGSFKVSAFAGRFVSVFNADVPVGPAFCQAASPVQVLSVGFAANFPQDSCSGAILLSGGLTGIENVFILPLELGAPPARLVARAGQKVRFEKPGDALGHGKIRARKEGGFSR